MRVHRLLPLLSLLVSSAALAKFKPAVRPNVEAPRTEWKQEVVQKIADASRLEESPERRAALEALRPEAIEFLSKGDEGTTKAGAEALLVYANPNKAAEIRSSSETNAAHGDTYRSGDRVAASIRVMNDGKATVERVSGVVVGTEYRNGRNIYVVEFARQKNTKAGQQDGASITTRRMRVGQLELLAGSNG